MLKDALSRTLLLMRGDLRPDATDADMIAALTCTRVVVRAGADAVATPSGQSAVVATALTLARSGHEVWVDCPDAELLGPQPPLAPGALLASLAETGSDLLPGRSIQIGRPAAGDLAIAIGTIPASDETRTLHFDADDWSVEFGPEPTSGWSGGDWPLGALAIAPLAGAEAFKTAMRKLASHALSPSYYAQLHAPTERAQFALAPSDTPTTPDLPPFDIVSGGAIANAALFALLRLPGASGRGRVLDHDESAMSNLNRNALLRRSALGVPKVEDMAHLARGTGIAIEPVAARFEPGMPVAPTVLVGVDDIPSRWAVQASRPDWVGVGATDRYSVLVSSHAPPEPCSGCLHPAAPPPNDAPIPTCAFVSFLSGLFLAARWTRSVGGRPPRADEQQLFLNALRPETWAFGSLPIAPSPACPVGCAASMKRAA